MAQDACRADDLVVIEERLAHPHEDRASHRPIRLDARAVTQLEEVLEKAVRRAVARRDAQRLGGGLQLDALDQLAADSTHGAEVVLASLHGGGEQLAADLLRDAGTEERGGVLGQHSRAVADPCRLAGTRTVSCSRRTLGSY